MMAIDLTGKRILVTGAGRGIGRHLAKAIANAGGEVFALGRNKDDLDSLSLESDRIHAVLADLSDWEATRAAVGKLESLDGVVNNAAVSNPLTPALDVPKEMLERTLNVNVLAAINIIQSTGRKMVAAGKGGSIVNISSILGRNPEQHALSYCMSKAALDMVTKQFALELGPHQIRVNAVNPHVTMTDMGSENWDNERGHRLKALTPMGRFCELPEVIGPILYFLSDHSTMVTGTVNLIDGGLLSTIAV